MSSVITRQRRRKRNVRGMLLPLIAIGALAAAIYWPPSRNWFQNGPLHPVWAITGAGWAVVSKPLTFIAQNQHIANIERDKRLLNTQLEAERQEIAQRDDRIKQLENQMKATLASIANATPAPAQPPGGAPPGALPPGTGNVAAAPVSAGGPSSSDIARTAAYWNAMDPEKAALVVKKLPVEYVSKVFAKMPSDQVAEIMNALSPTDAAKFANAVPLAQ